MTSSAVEVEGWLKDHLPGETALGVDIEWKPSFNQAKPNKAALLQLATPRSVLLYQLRHLHKAPQQNSLKDVLLNHQILKVGVGVKDDLLRLQSDYGLHFAGYRDIGTTTKRLRPGLVRTGLASIFESYFGVDIPKPKDIQMSNWEATVLNSSQIQVSIIPTCYTHLDSCLVCSMQLGTRSWRD